MEVPAGEACSFALGIDLGDSGKRVERDFYDAEGNLVRSLSAVVGSQLTFTNLANGETLALRANGAVMRTVFNADGSQTVTITGHNVLILFPTDVPAGLDDALRRAGRLHRRRQRGVHAAVDQREGDGHLRGPDVSSANRRPRGRDPPALSSAALSARGAGGVLAEWTRDNRRA